MNEPEKVLFERSQKLKEEGNKAFSNGQYEKALSIYTKALEILHSNHQGGIQNVDYNQISSVLDLNISMCYYKLGKLEQSLSFVDRALENNSEYVKAYYRKSVILKDMKNYQDSIICLKRLLGLDPKNKEAKDLLEQLRNELIQEDSENKNPVLLLEKELKHSDLGKK